MRRSGLPRLGFGTAGLGDQTDVAVLQALREGYRPVLLLDSAQAREWYREDLVGDAIWRSGAPRHELFLVSKLHPRHLGFASTIEHFEDSLTDLNTPYLDAFLLHYPACFPAICSDGHGTGTWKDRQVYPAVKGRPLWKALEHLYKANRVRAIGVSNFSEEELQELLEVATIAPHIVQSRSDPLAADIRLQAFCKKSGIQYMGYSTLGSQWLMLGHATNPVLNHPVIKGLAEGHSCSSAQVALKWAMAKGQVVIPRSSSPERMAENFRAAECNLTAEDLVKVDRLDGSQVAT
eukprot:SM000017S02776  [mRNA]  locus=s17:171261:174279:- [translate_table: standard]